ncbi:tRNA-uridine aminocarboxypropyltransferase [Vibrio sp. LaRot3]|uniref:tRNA-uridine aminocarboxypropyltransferase n=1 Tax=Vibrio sp. LaRot3 TaxID=2998829 RepID=UPI0022CE1F20|nr:tRNA-uridine aminocarboxypropyltransferase [Vibrio sp. LaRot3]MDA0147590.1 DTW domain-containing protein [Vibrio sp. LaRot3]
MRIHGFHHLYQLRQQNSTKAFAARGSKVERCQYCQVAQKHCICGYQPDVDSDVAVMLLVSENEVFKPSNTGRLIVDTIKESYVYQWNRTEPDSDMLALIQNPQYQPIVVFPDEYVEDKQRLMAKQSLPLTNGKKPLFIFLDGSWREARRIFRKSPYLQDLPVLSIQPEQLSQYQMRKSDNEQHLSTAEVAVLILEAAGELKASNTLEQWFAVFRESYLLSKTRLKPDFTRPELKRYLAANPHHQG